MKIEPSLATKSAAEIQPAELFIAFLENRPVFSMKTIGPEGADQGDRKSVV